MNNLGFYSGLIVFLGAVFGAFLAYRDSFFTVGQMFRRGIKQGLPYILHGGMWGDLTIITWRTTRTMSDYGDRWTLRQWLAYGCIATIVSALMHWTYTKSTIPESHVINGRLRPTGWWHAIYMAGALTPFFLLYFATPVGMDKSFIISTSVWLQIHIFIGTHIPLGFICPKCYGRRPDMAAWLTNGVVALLLSWRTYAIIAAS